MPFGDAFRWAGLLLVVNALAGTAWATPRCAGDFGQPGPFAVIRAAEEVLEPSQTEGVRITVVVLLPDPADPSTAAALANHLASHGFEVHVAPARLAAEELVRWLERTQIENVIALGAEAEVAVRAADLLHAHRLAANLSAPQPLTLALLAPERSAAEPRAPLFTSRRVADTFEGEQVLLSYGERLAGQVAEVLVLRAEDGGCASGAGGLVDALPERTEVTVADLKASQCNVALSAEGRGLVTTWFLHRDTSDCPSAMDTFQLPLVRSGRLRIRHAGPDFEHPVLQFNVSLLAGAALREGADPLAATFGLRPEVIFGRRSDRSWGWGPYGEVAVSTSGLGTWAGGGGTLLIPVHSGSSELFGSTALAASAGAYAGWHGLGPEPGATAGVFFGYRTFNDISHFDGTAGFRVDVRCGFGATGERAVILSAQFDAVLIPAFLASPAI